MFVVRQVYGKHLAKEKDEFGEFMDLEKAYDTIDQHGMCQIPPMYEMGGKLLTALKS